MRAPAIILTISLWLLAGGAQAQLYTEANGVLMTPRGAAGVDSDTLFRRDAIANALPGLRITTTNVMQEDATIPVILASDRGEVLLRIYGRDGRVYSVEGLSRRVYGPGRTQIGMPFRRVSGQNLTYCTPGMEEWSGAVLCGAAPDATLWFVFQPTNYGGPDGELPPPEALSSAELVQIRWLAEPPAIMQAGTE